MANNSIQTRFTESNYATKQEVIHELKTPLVDSFWKMIVSYRKGFERPLGIFGVDRSPITYCLCPSIASKIDESEEKLMALASRFKEVSTEGNDRLIYKQHSLIECLKEIAKANSLQVDDNFLRMVVTSRISNDDDSFKVLPNYVECLELLNGWLAKPIDEDLLAALYSRLSGTYELVSLYRTSDYLGKENRVIIDRLYKSAPAQLIQGMMTELLNVINRDELPVVVKSSLTYYYVTFIKPFPDYNEEIACLLTKLVIGKSFDEGSLALSINIEKLCSDLNEKVQKIHSEVQRNNDFTYFLDMYMKLLNDSVEKEIARMNNLEALSLKKEYYKDDLEEAKSSTVYVTPTSEVEYQQTANVEYQKPASTPVQDVQPMPASVNSMPQPSERVVSGLAISALPPMLDEKEAQRLEEHLLETDPELKRSQAYFYARHCTMGKRYTINQFKKEVGCAYETARTSMDALASLGYYRQEMVKNKKVYTPIKRN